MKKVRFLLTMILSVFTVQGFAQVSMLAGDGFYRVQNYETKRYAALIDNKGTVDVNKRILDVGAINMVAGFENVESDPGSIIYVDKMESGQYQFFAQGTSTTEITGLYLSIFKGHYDGTYLAGATSGMFRAYLMDPGTGNLSHGSRDSKNVDWNFFPLTNDDKMYFGAKPEFSAKGMYLATMYTDFAYKLSSNVRAFYVSAIGNDGKLTLNEIFKVVPGKTAVILVCKGSLPVDNKLLPTKEAVAPISGNLLKGVFFNSSKSGHVNQTAYNASTMRVLKLSGSNAVFGNSSSQYLAANKAYLEVPASASEELMFDVPGGAVTPQEKATVKVGDYSMTYGDELPAFSYAVTEGTIDGEPLIYCKANSKSPVGTYDIVVSQGTIMNPNVTFINGTLTIHKAELTASVGKYVRKQGEKNPEFVISYSGFKNDEDISVVTKCPVATTTADETSAPGDYPITVSGGEAANYSFKYVDGVLTVGEADLVIITANSYSVEYGQDVPVFEYTVNGGTLMGTPEISCDLPSTVPVPAGTYDIVVSKGTVESHNVAFVNGKLTVNKAVLTASVGDYTREQGQKNPVFVINYSGFKNNEDSSVITVYPVATTEADESSVPGQYPIVVTGGSAANYTFKYVSGTLFVTETSGIDGLLGSGMAFDVYSLNGVRVKKQVRSLEGLPKGVYLVNGAKVIVQ
ncbi:MAG: MBG domain-containing protein [Prevotellaceae bacterium]|nr:MBG domain-containing protein [Prevotellaceae bacterium]